MDTCGCPGSRFLSAAVAVGSGAGWPETETASSVSTHGAGMLKSVGS